MSQIDDLLGRLGSALTRIQANEAAVASADQAKDQQISDLQAELSSAEGGLVDKLTPLVEQAEAISPPPPPPAALEATATLDAGVVGEAYAGAISISGGVAPYSVSSEPPSQNGLTVNADGSISGTPEAEGSDSFDLTVTDSASPPASVSLSVEVAVNAPAA